MSSPITFLKLIPCALHLEPFIGCNLDNARIHATRGSGNDLDS